MKELTIEQKAKAYDEAIKRIQSYVVDEYGCTRIKVVNVFPELKESEDERIRKRIIALVYAHGQGMYKDEMLAWLEKQGEQKPTEEYNIRSIGSKHAEGKLGEMIKNLKPADKIEPKFKVGDIVKHKDNPHLTYILKRFTDDGDYEFHAIGKDGNEGETCFVVVKYQDDWELVEQKPTKWSKEDERMINKLIAVVELYYGVSDDLDKQSCLSWLESKKERLILI